MLSVSFGGRSLFTIFDHVFRLFSRISQPRSFFKSNLLIFSMLIKTQEKLPMIRWNSSGAMNFQNWEPFLWLIRCFLFHVFFVSFSLAEL